VYKEAYKLPEAYASETAKDDTARTRTRTRRRTARTQAKRTTAAEGRGGGRRGRGHQRRGRDGSGRGRGEGADEGGGGRSRGRQRTPDREGLATRSSDSWLCSSFRTDCRPTMETDDVRPAAAEADWPDRWAHLDRLLMRPGPLATPDFEPGDGVRVGLGALKRGPAPPLTLHSPYAVAGTRPPDTQVFAGAVPHPHYRRGRPGLRAAKGRRPFGLPQHSRH